MAFLGVNEHQIDIGTVIEFLPAQFAQAQNAEFRRPPALVGVAVIGLAETLAELLSAHAVNGVQANVGHAGDFPGDFGGAAQTGQVPRRDAQHFPLLELAQLREGGGVVG